MDERKNVEVDVSVIMTTYGHEDFIERAIQGVLEQNFKGSIELLLSNDKSPDGTHEIIESILNRNAYPPNISVRYFNHLENKGSIQNFYWTYQQARGRFIAVCEGDDYWIDTNKIQNQVDFLDENLDCNLVYHRVLLYDNEDGRFMHETLNKEEEITKKDLIELSKGNFIHTPSVMFRNNLPSIDLLKDALVGDYVLWFLNGELGKFGYLPNFMAVYRMSNTSIFGKKSRFFQSVQVLKAILNLKNYTKDEQVKANFTIQSQRISEDVGITALNAKEFSELVKLLVKISPNNISYLLKRISEKLVFRKASVISIIIVHPEIYAW